MAGGPRSCYPIHCPTVTCQGCHGAPRHSGNDTRFIDMATDTCQTFLYSVLRAYCTDIGMMEVLVQSTALKLHKET